jgi:adenine-specific DNA-methyltransferase
VWIEEGTRRIAAVGDPLPLDKEPTLGEKKGGLVAAWPVRSDGSLGRWGVGATTLRGLVTEGYASAGRYDPKRNTYGINYLSQLLRRQTETRDLLVLAKDPSTGVADVVYAESAGRKIKTVWHRSRHDVGANGSDLLTSILGLSNSFSFPKSVYATGDTIAAVVRNNPSALIVDFFAGSGTTLNAVNLLNLLDGGKRRCILITNNEVSAEDADSLRVDGHQSGDDAWEQRGICRSVTWPRSKFTILGKRADGVPLPGEYLTGKLIEKERARSFTHVSFLTFGNLDSVGKKKQLVSLIENLPQNLVTENCVYIVSADHTVSILFDDNVADD